MMMQRRAGLYSEKSKHHTISRKYIFVESIKTVVQLFPMPLIHHIQKMASTAPASMLPKYSSQTFRETSKDSG
jgi:hypothetical protein